jgi:cytochrome c-type biogenesis protein
VTVEILDHAGVGVLLIAFAGGLLSFFSPCVAPLVPGYIGYLSGTVLQANDGGTAVAVGQERRLPALAQASLLFVAGFSATFIALGLLAGSFGGLIVAYRPVMETIAGIVMLVMGVFLLGLFPREWTELLMREGRVQLSQTAVKRLGAAAPFALGVVFAAGWTPCIGPVLAAILVYAGASGSTGQGALLLTIYSLGFAVPFLAVGFGLSAGVRALGWVKRHGHAISLVSGALLVALGVLYLAGQSSIFAVWAQRLGTPFLQ